MAEPDETRTVLLVAGEDVKHCVAVRQLVDRLLVDCVDWLSAEELPRTRRWNNVDDFAADPEPVDWAKMEFLDVAKASKLARDLGIRVRGHFDGEAAIGEASVYRNLFKVVAVKWPDVHALIVVRDVDRQPDRYLGFRQARGSAPEDHKGIAIVGAFPEPEIEAWYLAGFEPTTPKERSDLTALTDRCGFDPREMPHRLTSKRRSDKRDAKCPGRCWRRERRASGGVS